jgi:hypothetical protein
LQAGRLVRGPGQRDRGGGGEDDTLWGGRRAERDAGPGRRAGVAVLGPVRMPVRVVAGERVKPPAGRASYPAGGAGSAARVAATAAGVGAAGGAAGSVP